MKSRGFTLIEMLVVISIIAVLAGVGLATFTNAQKKSRDARRMADLEAVRSALEIYRADNPSSGYPDTDYTGLGAILTNYIVPLPSDPFPAPQPQYTYSKVVNGYQLCATREIMTPSSYCLSPP